MFGLGGELAKEVAFVFMFDYYFVQAHFVMFSGLLGSLSIKGVILNSLIFQNLDPLLPPKFFCVLPSL